MNEKNAIPSIEHVYSLFLFFFSFSRHMLIRIWGKQEHKLHRETPLLVSFPNSSMESTIINLFTE